MGAGVFNPRILGDRQVPSQWDRNVPSQWGNEKEWGTRMSPLLCPLLQDDADLSGYPDHDGLVGPLGPFPFPDFQVTLLRLAGEGESR